MSRDFKRTLENKRSQIQDVLFKAQADLEKLSSMKGEITGVPSGYYDIDRLFCQPIFTLFYILFSSSPYRNNEIRSLFVHFDKFCP